MRNFKKNLYGASIIALAFSFSGQALAQTCSTPPDCKTLGFTKTAADCSGKTILKCPFNQAQVYCPGGIENNKIYKVRDTYTDSNGIALGKVAVITGGGLHGTIVSTAIFNGTQTDVSNSCVKKTSGGLTWGLATATNISHVTEQDAKDICYWVAEGSCIVGDNGFVNYCNSTSYECNMTETKIHAGRCQAEF